MTPRERNMERYGTKPIQKITRGLVIKLTYNHKCIPIIQRNMELRIEGTSARRNALLDDFCKLQFFPIMEVSLVDPLTGKKKRGFKPAIIIPSSIMRK